MSRHDLSDFAWSVIEPLLPNKSRGVARVDDRRVLNGIFWRFRTGSPWADLPERYGPRTTCYNRFVRWREAGIWDRFVSAMSEAVNGEIVMIDSSSVRVHQHGSARKKERESRRRRRYGPLQRRFDHQDPCRRGHRRPPNPLRSDGRPDQRLQTCPRSVGGPRNRRRSARRQGL